MFCLLPTCSDLCVYPAGFLLSYLNLNLRAFQLQQSLLAAGWILDSSLSATSIWPARLLHYGVIPNILYHLVPFKVILKRQLLLRCFWFYSHEVTISHHSLATVLRRTPLDSPLSCCTAVISHLFFCFSQRLRGPCRVFILSAAMSLEDGVFPRVILIYSSIEPAHSCLDQLWSCSIQLDPLSLSLAHYPTHITCSSSVSRGEIWNRVGVCPTALNHSGAWITD